jgi:dethiobiotin synthetase
MTRMNGFFVTGTDTGVGKTETACGLIQALQDAGWSTVSMKPVAAGARHVGGQLRNSDVERLDRASRVRAPRRLRNPYVFAPAIAPHIASAEAGVPIDAALLAARCEALSSRADVVVVEGAGGFRVPLGPDEDFSDFAVRIRLPVILVVGMRLGCLSHALLTAEAVERRGLPLAGWVANRVEKRMHRYRENVATLRSRIAAPLLAVVPYVPVRARRQQTVRELIDVVALSRWLPIQSVR